MMNQNRYGAFLAAGACLLSMLAPTRAEDGSWDVEEVTEIAPAWAGHPVGFDFQRHGDRLLVAFYDGDRRLTVGSRSLDSAGWQLVRLPSQVGWDSHNYLTMVVDDEGLIHLSGNMHGAPLVYFRTTRPLDITRFERIGAMVGTREQRCTYPRFLRDGRGRLIFTYRDGGSGNGDQIWNVYDPSDRSWSRLLDQPLFSGQGQMNAYFTGPVRDRDGVFHICWVWRDTPDCATNHDLCYARSTDLVHWETSDGRPLELPITLENAEIVDPVPPGGGLINGNTRIGFDLDGRPVLSYHKHDEAGNTQIYNARKQGDRWVHHRVTDWDHRWEFSGGGSIGFAISVQPVRVEGGRLIQAYRHEKYGQGRWLIDPETLRPTGPAPRPSTPSLPPEIGRVESDLPGMSVRTLAAAGPGGDVRYVLRWETLPPNRDRPHPGDPPPPSPLRLYTLRKAP